MKTRCLRQILSLAVMSAGLLVAVASSAQPIDWNTAVNDNDEAPDGRPGSTFFSYNQPSLNDDGMTRETGAKGNLTSPLFFNTFYGFDIKRP